jgi:hypothetical protein
MSDGRIQDRTRRPDVAAVLSRLKGFQRASVEHAFERLYLAPDSTRRFLVADEVGLGKTLVARGIIAKAIDRLWEEVDRIDVVYICSNSQIARQNVNRLRIGGTSEAGSGFVTADRLTLLPTRVRDLRRNKVNYLAFTPGTSFDLKSSLGRKDERVLLYWLVQGAWPVDGTGAMNLFQGWVGDPHGFRALLERFRREAIDPALAEAFEARLRHEDGRRTEGGPGLRDEYLDLCHRFRYFRAKMPAADRADQARVIGRLRSLLAEVCVDALEPDLVILDEFQRFKDVLDGEDEMAELARRLFTYSDESADARLLLLSATPYKMYTLRHEEEEDDHYRDFVRTVKFLDPALGAEGAFDEHLASYRRELFRLRDGSEDLLAAKNRIESQLRRIMCRTERLRESEDAGGMLRQVPVEGMALDVGDVKSLVTLARIGEAVEQPQVLDYWKSAPYLLNFMDRYRLKGAVVARLGGASGDGALASLLEHAHGVLLSWSDVETYQALDPGNAAAEPPRLGGAARAVEAPLAPAVVAVLRAGGALRRRRPRRDHQAAPLLHLDRRSEGDREPRELPRGAGGLPGGRGRARQHARGAPQAATAAASLHQEPGAAHRNAGARDAVPKLGTRRGGRSADNR